MAVIGAVEPLNQFLCELHGPTDSISRTIGRLVPFPSEIGSLPDAELLDLSISAEVTSPAGAFVRASGRYSTSSRLKQAKTFYEQEFRRLDASLASVVSERSGTRVTITANVGASNVQHCVMIDELHGYRAVKMTAEYHVADRCSLFERFAHWHNGEAPVSFSSSPSGFDISTFASGRRPNTLGLYTTHYACDQTSLVQRRKMVDQRMTELGWSYTEPRHGILFIRGCDFPAETHVLGDDESSVVTVVGEFQLR